jgi:hypothetical protein
MAKTFLGMVKLFFKGVEAMVCLNGGILKSFEV